MRILFHFCWILGALLTLVAGTLDFLGGRSFQIGLPQALLLATGVFLLVLALFLGKGWLRDLIARVALATVVIVSGVALLEVTFRLLDYDFERLERRLAATPIYYQIPRTPTGQVYFRRAGPKEWSGRPINSELELLGAVDADSAYRGEQPIEVRYDEDGFRNPSDLPDWEIVVIGDSFVELGHLGYDELFTTRLGRLLGKRVRNLGVSFTGSFTHVHYLRKYGTAPSTTDAVLVFFEGNDLDDTIREKRALEAYRRTGKREYRVVEQGRQTSFVVAGARFISSIVGAGWDRRLRNALLEHRADSVPITVSYAPPAEGELDPETLEAVEEALHSWASAAACMGLRPWLVFMPSKHRVLHGHVRFLDDARTELGAWVPSDLPDLVSRLAARDGVEFIDVTDELVESLESGELPFNGLFDTHLNRVGSRVVARTLASRMSSHPDAEGDSTPHRPGTSRPSEGCEASAAH